MPHGYAIAIGAQKCSTSWLYDVLTTHPEVAIAPCKEIDFFSYHHDRGHAWYERQFGAGKLRLDVSPSYFHDPRGPGRVADFAPHARIVALLRDPAERAFSNHLHEIAKGHIAPVPFAEGLRNNPDYIDQGRYHRHLARWIERFGGQVLCLLAEEVHADPAAALIRVCRHMGLASDHGTGLLTDPRNVSDMPRNAALRRLLRTGGDGLRKLGLEEALLRIKRTAPVAAVLRRNAQPVRALIPPMSPSDRAAVLDHLADDILALPDLLGRQGLPWQSWREARHRAEAAPTPRAVQG